MWLVLNDKVLTWEALENRNKLGHWICLLFRGDELKTSHFFFLCCYSRQVWAEVGIMHGEQNILKKDNIGYLFLNWFTNRELNQYKSAPLVVLWGIQLHRNSILFENKSCLGERFVNGLQDNSKD